MRAGLIDVGFIYDDNNNFIGINLGWDFCGEHDFYTNEIASRLKENSSDLIFKPMQFKNNEVFVLCLPYKYANINDGTWFNKNKSIKSNKYKYFDFYERKLKEDDMCASWDNNSFAICVKNNHKKELELLYKSLKENKVSIYKKNQTNPFGSSGLCLKII